MDIGPASFPPRPEPPLTIAERASRWLRWFGTGRLISTALAVVVVGAGGYWLLRTPAAPPEASLPRATTTVAPQPVPSTASTTAPSAVLVVHVAGAVNRPGVYELPSDARVGAAVDAAGGVLVDADPNALNLAAPIVDGQRVYVPVIGEAVPVAAHTAPAPSAAGSAGIGVAAMVDLNRATAEELDTLPGIGPATAAAIVRHRDEHGPFPDVEALLDVPGIGPAKLDGLRDLVAV